MAMGKIELVAKKTNKLSRFRTGKRRRRYNKYNKATTLYVRNPSATSDRAIVKLRYTHLVSLTTTTATGIQVMRGNGAFDPNFTGAGNQPLGWDQWIAFYDRYYCIGSSMRFCGGVTTGNSAIVSIRPSTVSSSPATINLALEKQRVKWKIADSGGSSVNVSAYHNTLQVLGKPKNEYQDGTLSALTTSLPNSEWYWHFECQAPDATTSTTVQGVIVMTYYLLFFDRKNLSQS